ncbi:MAG: MmgE/PrpD family protein [Anderseniella sp.]|nr:MmgE/PrpD family protein [Anderseniella sp.]
MQISHTPGVAPGQISTETGLCGHHSLTERLVDLCQASMSAKDRTCAATHLYDWIGVAVAGAVTDSARPVLNLARTHYVGGRCTALGVGGAGPENAAFVNGSFGTLLEMDDLHRSSILHAGDVVIPAALAAAQYAQVTGTTLLEAIIVGYEVALRIGQSAVKGGYSAWYNSGTCGVFGAATAAAHALGLTAQQKADALGQAGMQASGLWQCRLEPTDSKCLATAQAARAGVTAALLSAEGLRGARHILEGELGFFRSFYPAANPDAVLDPAEAGWKLHEVSLKPWPACRHIHPAVGIALEMRDDMDVSTIDKVVIESYEAGRNFCDVPDPVTAHEARFSFQHCVAVTLLQGEPALGDFEAAALGNPVTAALRSKILVRDNPELTSAFPDKMGAGLIVTLNDGTTKSMSTDHAPGDPEQPMSPEAIRAKFRRNLQAAGVSGELANGLDAAVLHLDAKPSIQTLAQHLDDVSVIISNPQAKGVSQ